MDRRNTSGARAIATAKVGLFDVRAEWQAREEKELDLEHVAQLAAVLEEGGDLPPLSVVKMENGTLAVVDGYHRFRAYVDAGHDRIPFEIVAEGAERIPFHLGHANSQHGRGRSPASKRRSVLYVLESPEGADLDNVGIARWCGVSVNLVRSVRAEVRGAPSASAERRDRAEAVAELAPDATEAEVASIAAVDDRAASRATGRASRKRANARLRDDAEVPSRAEPPTTDAAALPFEPVTSEPEWQARARANAVVMNAITKLKRDLAAVLPLCVGSQQIVEALDRARGVAKLKTPQACPAPHGDGECFICSGKGFVIGDPGNWQAQLAARERAHA